MALSDTGQGFHDLIVLLNKAQYLYNLGKVEQARYVLAGVMNGCDTLRHHLEHEIQKQPEGV